MIDRLGLARAREAVGSMAQGRLELRAPQIEQKGVVCFASRWLQEEHARLGWRPDNARVVPSGVEIERVRALRKAPPSLPPRRILYAGRIHPTKGLHVLITALATFPGLQLTAAGLVDDRRYLARVRRLARALGVESRISWLGELPREQVLGLLGSHDVFVYPSIAAESGWLGLLEGLAAGAIVVTSAPGAPRELVVHRQNALLFPAGDALGLSEQLRLLHDEPTLGVALLRGARKTVHCKSLVVVLDQVEAALSEDRTSARGA
jgi:glycosyltransferase involved in cell wall biosynthesis